MEQDAARRPEDYLFPNRVNESPNSSTWQYSGVVQPWVKEIRLGAADCGTHTVLRTAIASSFQLQWCTHRCQERTSPFKSLNVHSSAMRTSALGPLATSDLAN